MGNRANRAGIVHLGLGAFFRAHAALYIEEAMAASGGNWQVIGVSLKSSRTRDALRKANWAFTTVELGDGTPKPRQSRVLADVLVAPEDPEAVLAVLARAETRIVTLTITEKGYCFDRRQGGLDHAHPDIAADLKGGAPISAPGYLVEALARRRAAGLAPFTVLSLDNMPANGTVIRRVVTDLARARGGGLVDWINAYGAFPSSMVDRIVPAITEACAAKLSAVTREHEPALVQHEPFRQWVLEDRFVDGARPDLGAVGVTLVDDVAPFEKMKLRMPNGAHSALAYLGLLMGHRDVRSAIADPVLFAFVMRLWEDEVIPTLTAPPDTDLSTYAETLLARFANPGIDHQLTQIATDGSEKLGQRIAEPLLECVASTRPTPCLIAVLAGWIRTMAGRSDNGFALPFEDPRAEPLKGTLPKARTARNRVMAVAEEAPVFAGLGPETLGDIADTLTFLETRGCRATLERISR
ncbi:MAG: mannitol dehydrogenase family protein [Pseudomonadota bacterium]